MLLLLLLLGCRWGLLLVEVMMMRVRSRRKGGGRAIRITRSGFVIVYFDIATIMGSGKLKGGVLSEQKLRGRIQLSPTLSN